MLRSGAVQDPVSVDVLKVEDARLTAGLAGPQPVLAISHQPPLIGSAHVTGHMDLPPGVQPRLEALMQASTNLLVRLKRKIHM